jgi:hypothetical protein
VNWSHDFEKNQFLDRSELSQERNSIFRKTLNKLTKTRDEIL